MTAPRGIALVGAALLNLALAAAAPRPSLTWLHPVAPPLTHIPAMAETVLAGETPSARPASPPRRGPPGPHAGGPPRGPAPLRGLAGVVERVVRQTGSAGQRAGVEALRAADARVLPLAQRSTALRVAVEADAVALARALGPARVGAVLARKDELSTRIGEGRAWRLAIERLE